MAHKNEVPGESDFLSTVAAGPRLKRTILVVLSISLVGFAAGLPLVQVQLAEAPAFIVGYGGVRCSIDVITAVLLFGQLCSFARGRCSFSPQATSSIAVPQGLTFPGAFSPTGLLVAGPQTAAWLYILWHFGFPLFVLGYALAARSRNDRIASIHIWPS